MIHEQLGEHKVQRGCIEVICGSMFSGKTEELIRRLKRAQIAGQRILIFKSEVDKRYHENDVVSHDSRVIKSHSVANSKEILAQSKDADVVGIDEVQFFDESIIEVCQVLANNGKRVIIAGLDLDYKGNPFGPMPELMAIAEYVTKVHAICVECGNLAHYSYRKSQEEQLVMTGSFGAYTALCRNCFNQKNKKG
jgi:thymidine kinase